MADLSIQAGLCNFVAENRVGVLQGCHFFRGYFAENTDAKPRTRERLAPNEIGRDAEFFANRADFIFKQITQRLDDAGEANIFRQAANVVVALNDGRIARAAFDNIRVNGPLAEELYAAKFFGFRFKRTDKAFADNLALLFGIRNALELFQKLRAGVHADQVHIELLAENTLHFVPFVFAQHAVIDKNAG